MESKDFIPSISFKSKNGSENLVSSNGQSIFSRSKIKKVYFFSINDKDFKRTRIIFSNKIKQKPKPHKENIRSILLPNLQLFKQKLLSGSGLV